MNEHQAKEIIQSSGAHMNESAHNQAIEALLTADLDHGTFQGRGYSAYWHRSQAHWIASITVLSTRCEARFDAEEKAIVWLANRVGALRFAYRYATRDYAEVVLHLPDSHPPP